MGKIKEIDLKELAELLVELIDTVSDNLARIKALQSRVRALEGGHAACD